MISLGISQDRHHAGVALSDGERVLYAAGEERFTRRKNQGGFPSLALDAAFHGTGVGPADVERICLAGVMTPPLVGRAFPGLQRWLLDDPLPSRPTATNRLVDFLAFHTPLAHTSPHSSLRRMTRALLPAAARRTLHGSLRTTPLAFVEHHHAHAAAACFLSGFGDALCLTADGMGDGLSATVGRWAAGSIERLWSADSRDSLGLFYDAITEALGFVPNRHEGKVTGLAAHGDATRVDVQSPFSVVGRRLVYDGPHGRRCVAWARDTLARRHRREDVASWAQRVVESNLAAIATEWLHRTGLRRLVLAGGVFGNVKLNQRLHELDAVDEIFVCPNMGDGGLSLGAICAEGGLAPQRLGDVFWGDEFGDASLLAALRERGLDYETCDDIEERVAALVASGSIVARFRGRMEWGPRALGNRSVLAPADDPSVVALLNARLRRSEFMPFAPAVLEDDADGCFQELRGARHAAEFMTLCFRATPRMRCEHPATVHVDGTARPQIVRREANPSLHRLLVAYRRRTGRGLILNTSFNIHDEPIVRTPAEALGAFLSARLDYLALGPYLVRAPGPTPGAVGEGVG